MFQAYQRKENTKSNEKDERIVKELFVTMDTNKDGYISEEELEIGLTRVRRSNPTKEEIKQILDEMGVKEGQDISFTKFRACLLKYVEYAKEKKVDKIKIYKDVFEAFDTNNDGALDKSEFITFLNSIGERHTKEEIDLLFEEADIQRDGKLQFNEFIRIYMADIK
ncbi:hypothetical protein ACF0H5_002728 [Mactra antiquata]